MELKVALCQFDMVWEDTAANLRTAGRMVAEADADLVILPEMFATGFVTDPGRVAQPMSGEIVQEMIRWSKTTGKAVAGGPDDGQGRRWQSDRRRGGALLQPPAFHKTFGRAGAERQAASLLHRRRRS